MNGFEHRSIKIIIYCILIIFYFVYYIEISSHTTRINRFVSHHMICCSSFDTVFLPSSLNNLMPLLMLYCCARITPMVMHVKILLFPSSVGRFILCNSRLWQFKKRRIQVKNTILDIKYPILEVNHSDISLRSMPFRVPPIRIFVIARSRVVIFLMEFPVVES